MDINSIMQELAQYNRMLEELNATVEGLKDTIKAYMLDNNLDVIIGNEHKVSYKDVTSNRIDTSALKKNYPDIAQQYTKTVTSKRFMFS